MTSDSRPESQTAITQCAGGVLIQGAPMLAAAYRAMLAGIARRRRDGLPAHYRQRQEVIQDIRIDHPDVPEGALVATLKQLDVLCGQRGDIHAVKHRDTRGGSRSASPVAATSCSSTPATAPASGCPTSAGFGWTCPA